MEVFRTGIYCFSFSLGLDIEDNIKINCAKVKFKLLKRFPSYDVLLEFNSRVGCPYGHLSRIPKHRHIAINFLFTKDLKW